MNWAEKRLREKFKGYPCALPDSLIDPSDGIGKPHSDWPPGLKWMPRSWNARGPRCGPGSEGYLRWPPRLVEGVSVARWENNFAKSRVFIPALVGKKIKGGDVYGEIFKAFEEPTGKEVKVKLSWRELSWDEITKGVFMYSPSALQKYSGKGWMRLSPSYFSRWYILKQREFPDESKNTGEDTVLFYRTGYRPDHNDVYFNNGPSTGLHWE